MEERPLNELISDPNTSVEDLEASLKRCPEAAAKETHNGQIPFHNLCSRIPFHNLCTNDDISLELLQAYLKCSPEAAVKQDNFGASPLLAMCNNTCDGPLLEPLRAYLKCSPEAAILEDNLGRIPFQFLCARKSLSVQELQAYLECSPEAAAKETSDGRIALHDLCDTSSISVEVLQAYLGCSPEAAAKEDRDGSIAFHGLCRNSPVSVEKLQAYLECSPEAATKETKSGENPLHLLCHNANNISRDILEAFLELCRPEVATKKDKFGQIPLHNLCAWGAQSNNSSKARELVEAYLKFCPKAGIEQNSDGEVPLHILCGGKFCPEFLESYLEHCCEVKHLEKADLMMSGRVIDGFTRWEKTSILLMMGDSGGWDDGVLVRAFGTELINGELKVGVRDLAGVWTHGPSWGNCWSVSYCKLAKVPMEAVVEDSVVEDEGGEKVPIAYEINSDYLEANLKYEWHLEDQRVKVRDAATGQEVRLKPVVHVKALAAAFMKNNSGFTPLDILWKTVVESAKRSAYAKAVGNAGRKHMDDGKALVHTLRPMHKFGGDAVMTIAPMVATSMDKYVGHNMNFLFWMYVQICFAVGGIVVYSLYGQAVVSTAGAVTARWCVPLGMVILCGMATETLKMLAAKRSNAMTNYFLTGQNMISMASIIISTVLIVRMAIQLPVNGPFRTLLSVGAFIQWLLLMEQGKNWNVTLSAYIQAVFSIFIEVGMFILVMGIFLVAFAQFFYLQASDEQLDLHDGSMPFSSFPVALLSTFAMTLGDFDTVAFNTPFMQLAFVIFMVIAFLVLTNMLIAIVGDAYDFARSESKRLYSVQRFAQIVEIETAFPNIDGMYKSRTGRSLLAATVFILGLIIFPIWIAYGLFYAYTYATSLSHDMENAKPWHLIRIQDGNQAFEEDDISTASWDGRVNNLKDYISKNTVKPKDLHDAVQTLKDDIKEPGPRGFDETCNLILEGQKTIQAQIADVDRRQAALEELVKSRGAA